MEVDVVAPPHGAADHDGEEDDVPGGAGDEEMRKPKIGRRPMLPTRAEVDEHDPLHLHYRSWCRHCRAGKARLTLYRVETADRERLGITFSADYAFKVERVRGDQRLALMRAGCSDGLPQENDVVRVFEVQLIQGVLEA